MSPAKQPQAPEDSREDKVDALERELQDATYEQLSRESQQLRERINRFRQALGRFFVDKQQLIDLMTICAVAQEPLLLVGPPGTAKSELVLKFKDALQIDDNDYFEYMLTRFTEPSEVIGRSTSTCCGRGATSGATAASSPPRGSSSSTRSSSRTRRSSTRC